MTLVQRCAQRVFFPASSVMLQGPGGYGEDSERRFAPSSQYGARNDQKYGSRGVY